MATWCGAVSEPRKPRLSYAELANIPSRYRPEIDPASRAVRLVHLGIGAFHRAHQAFYTDASGDWGICGVTQRSSSVVDQLAPQDGLYTLVVRGHDHTTLRLVGAVREVLFAGAEPRGVVEKMADPAVSIVSTTVTEKGYHHDPVSGALQFDDPEIAADLAGRDPRTVVGQLAAAVAARALAQAPAFTVVCCDNLPANGEFLGRLVRSFLERSSYPEAVLDWLAANVAFPSSMVDRITPASTAADRELVARELGVDDHGAVVTEPFTQWVIENRFAGARPQWENAGALLVPEVAPYEQLKLRVLNGSHSALAYLGGLAGYPTVDTAIADPSLAAFVRSFMRDDVVPTLATPTGVDVVQYQLDVLDRFANPSLRYRTGQVAMDGSHKLPQRVLATIRDRRRAGGTPVFAALVVAAWMRHIADGVDDKGQPFEPDDPMLDLLRAQLTSGASAADVVESLLKVETVFGDLIDDAWFRTTVARMLDDLRRHRVVDVVRAMTVGSTVASTTALPMPTLPIDGVA